MSRSLHLNSGHPRSRLPGHFPLSLAIPLALTTLLPGPLGLPVATAAQATGAVQGARIEERQVRISRGATGEVRVIEFLRVAPWGARDGESPATLALIRLQPQAFDLIGLGGDVPPERVIRSSHDVQVSGPFPAGRFQLALQYRLPADIPAVVLTATMPVDELLLLTDRAARGTRVDAALDPDGEEGSPAQPIARHRAEDLAAGREVVIRLSEPHRVGWRERIAVLAAACLAAGGAAAQVVGRARASRATCLEGRERSKQQGRSANEEARTRNTEHGTPDTEVT